MRMFLRTTICFKDFGKFEHKVSKTKKDDKIELYNQDYTGNHIAIFECELKQPPQMMLIDHSIGQFIDYYRMNFRNWKIVDIDNWMGGNPFFAQF